MAYTIFLDAITPQGAVSADWTFVVMSSIIGALIILIYANLKGDIREIKSVVQTIALEASKANTHASIIQSKVEAHDKEFEMIRKEQIREMGLLMAKLKMMNES